MSGYIPTVPTANETIADTQPLINTNFTVINTAFGVDHTPMTNSTYQGEHNKVTLTTRTSPAFNPIDPTPSPDGPILYSKVSGASLNEMYFETTGGTIVQLTNLVNPVVRENPGSTFLPGGIIIQWGIVNLVTPGGNAFTFKQAFPNGLFSLVVTALNTTATATSVSAQSRTGATISSANTNAAYYIAIGY